MTEFELWWKAFVNVNPATTEHERGIALLAWNRALMFKDAAIAQAVAREREEALARVAAVLPHSTREVLDGEWLLVDDHRERVPGVASDCIRCKVEDAIRARRDPA